MCHSCFVSSTALVLSVAAVAAGFYGLPFGLGSFGIPAFAFAFCSFLANLFSSFFDSFTSSPSAAGCACYFLLGLGSAPLPFWVSAASIACVILDIALAFPSGMKLQVSC